MTQPDEWTAVILCGGKGTRMEDETRDKPKAMVSIGGKPILWHILSHYRHYGVRRFVLCLGHLGDSIRDYFFNFRNRNTDLEIDLGTGETIVRETETPLDWRIVLAETGSETSTGNRILRALRHVEGNLFFATYGDGLANVDLARLAEFHRAKSLLATVTAVHPSSRFGELDIAQGLVTAFAEKPQVREGWINGGFFVFDRSAFDQFDSDLDLALEQDILSQVANDGQLAVYQHDGFWQCMDTAREMRLLNDMWNDGRAPWAVWSNTKGG